MNVSVATVKKEPRFAVAATTQALAGTPLRLLEFKAPFWRVQMPDGYIGWVHRLQIVRMSEQELSDWNASRRVVVTARSTTLTNENGTVLAPLTAGSILRLIEKQVNGFGSSCRTEIPVFSEQSMSGRRTRISPFMTESEGRTRGLLSVTCLVMLRNFSEHRIYGAERAPMEWIVPVLYRWCGGLTV